MLINKSVTFAKIDFEKNMQTIKNIVKLVIIVIIQVNAEVQCIAYAI